MDNQIIASAIAVAGTLIGAWIAAWAKRESEKKAALEKRIKRYKLEIRARQAEEDVAADWLFELGLASSPRAAKNLLRDRVEKLRGLRPGLNPSEMRDKI
jgi:hypothetical protein